MVSGNRRSRHAFIEPMWLIIVASVLAISAVPDGVAAADGWSYDDAYTDDLLFLHSFVNYGFTPDQDRDWERGLMRDTGFRLTSGSVSKSRLLLREDLVFNRDLGDGWWFRLRITGDNDRLPAPNINQRFIEFQKRIYGGIALCAAADLAFEKDAVDGRIGIMQADSTRTSWWQVWLTWDDLAWGGRNTSGGRTEREPFGIAWSARIDRDGWEIVTDGALGRGFVRRYDNPDASLRLLGSEEQRNRATLTMRRKIQAESRIEATVRYDGYVEERQTTDPVDWHRYRDELIRGGVRYVGLLGANTRLEAGAELVRQRDTATGKRDYRYRRREILPVCFVTRRFGRQDVRLGWFGSIQGWEYDARSSADPSGNYDHTGFADKVIAGWTWRFTKRATVHLALSHVVSIKRFGGGNFRVHIAL